MDGLEININGRPLYAALEDGNVFIFFNIIRNRNPHMSVMGGMRGGGDVRRRVYWYDDRLSDNDVVTIKKTDIAVASPVLPETSGGMATWSDNELLDAYIEVKDFLMSHGAVEPFRPKYDDTPPGFIVRDGERVIKAGVRYYDSVVSMTFNLGKTVDDTRFSYYEIGGMEGADHLSWNYEMNGNPLEQDRTVEVKFLRQLKDITELMDRKSSKAYVLDDERRAKEMAQLRRYEAELVRRNVVLPEWV